MEDNIQVSEKDTIVMKLLHYFITEKNYNPVVLHGAKDEIWLENMHSEFKIVRIVSAYIHNNEQLDMDLYKTKRISKNIQKKTFNFTMNVLNIFIDLGENVELKDQENLSCIHLTDEKDIKKYPNIIEYYPDIKEKLVFNEKGIDLFLKITNEINLNNKKKAESLDRVFEPKKPIITYSLIVITSVIFLLEILTNGLIIDKFALYGPYVKNGEIYRLVTSIFLHGNIIHLASNMYALSIIGKQVETLFGKKRFILIYLISGITGSLLSMLLNIDAVSLGASGAIFGLLGALLFFGYNYRAYLGNYMIKNILPVVIVNLGIGFMLTGIDNFAHIGGLIGGLLSSIAIGLEAEDFHNNKVHGKILLTLYVLFLIFMNFIYAR